MGNCRSWYNHQKAARRSAKIDRQIEQDGKELKRECKILLLGASESGKSTVVKQMLIHQGGLCYDTKMTYRGAIYSNLLENAQAIAAALHKFDIEPADPSNVEMLERVLEYDLDMELHSPTCPCPLVFPSQLAEAICRLWQDPGVPEFVDDYGSQLHLMDNATYFFTEARRITSADYVPTESDILRCRQRSTGILETTLNVPPLSIHLFEVGSQRSEHKKWTHYIESVTSVIFCTALSDYDREAEDQNRMVESLALFDSVINSRWFVRTSVILFLNKIDIFRDKLHRVPLERCFQEYTGGPNVSKATKYILWRFLQVNRAKLSVYPHVTHAMDTSNIRLVVAAVSNTIVKNSLEDAGIF